MIEETHSQNLHVNVSSDRRLNFRSVDRNGETNGRISTTATTGPSPYLQRLAHSNFIEVLMPEFGFSDRRRASSYRRRSTSMVRSCIDVPQTDDQVSTEDHLNLNLFLNQNRKSSIRPRSAPNRVVKKKKTMKFRQSLTVQNSITMIKIYRNGDISRSCNCRVTTLDAIFQFATEKLQMPSAARRLFDSSGREIVQVKYLQHEDEYFVSSGENFKDPFKPLKSQAEYATRSKWTRTGIQTDALKPDAFRTTAVISQRLNKQIPSNICLTIIKNGFGKNSGIDFILIDATRKKFFAKFLEDSTAKLGLNGHARRAFNYRGDEITSLKIFFQSAKSTMKTVTDGTIIGPLWITCGELFRPIGAFDYLQNRLAEFVSYRNERKKIHHELLIVEKQRKSSKKRKENDLNDSDDSESDKWKRKIKNRNLLSMDQKELDEFKERLENEIRQAEIEITLYEERLGEVQIERDKNGNILDRFVNDTIKEVKIDDKIVGRHPLRLIIHRNGTMKANDPKICLDLRPIPPNHIGKTSIEYLLTYLQNSLAGFIDHPARRVFDVDGNELKTLGQLTPEQHLFVSSGDNFQKPFQPCLAIEIQSVDFYKNSDGNFLLRTVRPDDDLMTEREKQSKKNVASTWKPVQSVPEDIRTIDFDLLNVEEQQILSSKPIEDRAPLDVSFITKNQKLIYPELKIKKKFVIEQKKENQTQKNVFSPVELQTWFYDKDGFIYNKCLKNLVLTVVRNVDLTIGWRPERLSNRSAMHETLTGRSVQLKEKRDEISRDQKWKFTTDGFIVLQSEETSALTDLSSILTYSSGEYSVEGLRNSENDPFVAFAAFCSKCPSNSPFVSRQRWAIRQESGFTIGDWRYSKVKNPQWHKFGFVWPVDADGNRISDLQWPIEGCLIPQVPPIDKLTPIQSLSSFVPIRLQVLKNGERELRKAVAVVGPDISNLIFEPKATSDVYRRLRIPEPEGEQRAQRQIQRMADARQREIKLFLENATELCKLPFAARRLFDTRGIEIFDLTSIPRDSYVYVTCGENWIDPALTKAEEQRRLLLANLSHDIRKIFFYCALRHPKEFAISAETTLTENSRLILNRCALTAKQRERVRGGESIEHVIQSHEPETADATEAEPRTAHERSHKLIDQRDKDKFRWPWERIANESLNLNDDEENPTDSLVTTADFLNLAEDRPKIPKTVSVKLQRFFWEETTGYIYSDEDKNLVFGVKEVEGKVIDVILKRRNPDDIFQRWIRIPVEKDEEFVGNIDYRRPFLIVSKARPTMTLTVLLPSCTDEDPNEMKVSFVGCQITLQQRRYEENGCANQKWRYDEHLGFFFAFNTTLTDKEITAANRANICSYAVHTEDLSQPGFTVSILNNTDQVEDVPVCLACSQAMRGKYRLTKIEAEQKFSCAIGKRTDLKFQGPFHCLNHKADLTRNEAQNTLFEWQNRLEQLRSEASVHQIARTLSAAKTVQMVHLLAYRNGDGRTKAGVKLIGSSVIGLLDQAAHRLNLNSAARRLYLQDGTVILTIEDLIEWAETFYLKQLNRKNSTNGNVQKEKSNVSNRFLEGNASKERFDSVPKLSDLKRALKNDSQLDMTYLLKFVIEVWVSTGEPFVFPSKADKRQEIRTTQREERTIVGHDFEREKHTLRQMKGRRISNQSPGDLVAQQNPIEPVVRHGHWTEKTDAELDKQEDVKVAQTSLKEIRTSQKVEATKPIVTESLDRLTQYPTTKRVMVYPNGETRDFAVGCLGTKLEEIMNDAKIKLNLVQPVQTLFDENGAIIESFGQLTRDQYIVAATGKVFISRTEKHHRVEVKASLSRTHREFGEHSTDVRVTSTVASSNLVEPFGPPLLTNDDRSKTGDKLSAPQRLAIERPKTASRNPQSRRLPTGRTEMTITEADSPSQSMKKSVDFSDDDEKNSEIQRITDTKANRDDSSGSSTPISVARPAPRPESPFSQLFASGTTVTPSRGRAQISSKRSDSDDENDEFMKMIRQK